MQVNRSCPRVVAIVGPTAVGKTEVSLQLAETLNGEIVSTDSRQFYRGMDIGTAKATSIELTRVPHHLIDVADPDEIWSLAVFQREAQKAILDITNRGKLPFLVGDGTVYSFSSGRLGYSTTSTCATFAQRFGCLGAGDWTSSIV